MMMKTTNTMPCRVGAVPRRTLRPEKIRAVSGRWNIGLIAMLVAVTVSSGVGASAQTSFGRPENPAVRAILDSKPSTPSDLFRAARLLVKFDRPGLAQTYLARLLSSKPDEATWSELVREYGTAAFSELALNKDLAPEGHEVNTAALAAAAKVARDPKRVAAAIERLKDPSPRVRREAEVDLQQAGMVAVSALVPLLADPAQQAFHANYQDALVAQGRGILRPLVGALESPDRAFRLQVIDLLGRLRDPDAVLPLLGPLVSPDEDRAVREAALRALRQVTGRVVTKTEAERYLREHLTNYLSGKVRLRATYGNKVELWHWDQKKKQLVAHVYDHDDALAVIAARLGRDLHLLVPTDRKARQKYLISLLKAATVTHGRDNPLPRGPGTPYAEVVGFGVEMIERVMADAMTSDQPAAAAAAAQILGDLGSAELLYRTRPSISPLVRAARHSDRRVRFAALSAIMKFQPMKPYAGSSFVPEALGFFAGSHAARRVLIGHPRAERARALAGALASLDLDAEIATNGRDFFRKATSSPDYEFLLVAYVIDRPEISLLLQELLRDRRTSKLPIGLLSTEGNFDRAATIARREKTIESFPYPLTSEGAQYLAGRLLALNAKDAVQNEERGRHALQSLKWLAQLLDTTEDRKQIYDLHRQEPAVLQALSVPLLSGEAARVAGKLGTPATQRALVDLASQSLRPIETRQQAAAAFDESVTRHGILLTRAEMERQYERFNASEKLDQETQAVLGTVLDSIERRTKTAKK